MIEKLYILTSSTIEITAKINEIIDYLEAKEEASKGECKNKYGFKHDFEPNEKGECWCRIPKESCYHYQVDPPQQEESKCPYLNDDCPQCYPKKEESPKEDEWEAEFDESFEYKLTDGEDLKGWWILLDKTDDAPVSSRNIKDYIKANFVSKEKIKTRYNRQRCAECNHIECKELDKFMESLGLGD